MDCRDCVCRESSALRAAMRKDRMNSKPKNSDLQVEIVLPENMRFMVEAEMAREREEAHRGLVVLNECAPQVSTTTSGKH